MVINEKRMKDESVKTKRNNQSGILDKWFEYFIRQRRRGRYILTMNESPENEGTSMRRDTQGISHHLDRFKMKNI